MHRTVDRRAIDPDAELLEALRRREATVAECLVATFGGRAYRLAIGITGNQQDAEEAVQDAFWNLIRKIDTFRGNAALGSWIYRITERAAYHTRRSAARRRDEISFDQILPSFRVDGHQADSILDGSGEIDDPAVQTEVRSVLSWALEELPDHYRAVIILHHVEGLSMAEVADSLDITVPTAKSRAHRARLFLREFLAGFHISRNVWRRDALSKVDETPPAEAVMVSRPKNRWSGITTRGGRRCFRVAAQ